LNCHRKAVVHLKKISTQVQLVDYKLSYFEEKKDVILLWN